MMYPVLLRTFKYLGESFCVTSTGIKSFTSITNLKHHCTVYYNKFSYSYNEKKENVLNESFNKSNEIN